MPPTRVMWQYQCRKIHVHVSRGEYKSLCGWLYLLYINVLQSAMEVYFLLYSVFLYILNEIKNVTVLNAQCMQNMVKIIIDENPDFSFSFQLM